ncbi:Putative glutamate--cysteine ligase 2 [Baekduia alba]|uniref:carboxylate-amine ligase n=1 Tax=Baekduia alba TaxID=2997333 RepID=UPI00233FB4D9|nr:YbdK family carboxylate-amine ligase [Baekduia alba]WCB94688.1 Putative glutamate--cysteine ligase 2 [Baekduia alba]
MSLDTDRAAEAFAASSDWTVGLEEEFAILDADTLDMVPRFEELRDAATAGDAPLAGSIAGELISSEIEIRSGRGETLQDAQSRQRDFRRRLFDLAARRGVRLGATGTHPWADYREQHNIDTEHYRRVVDGLQYVARRNNTFSLHVHVGIRGADRAIAVCDRLRAVLPTLLAVSANSPYLDGRDAGLHSARSQSFTKSFPRCGIPDYYGDWATYAKYIDFLVATNSIVEYTQVWWSVRPHFSFGTVEVRIADAQVTAQESDALAALIVACVAQAARDEDEGRPSPIGAADLERRIVEENFWRAIRFGMDGHLIDFTTFEERPAPAAVADLLSWTAPMRAELGIEPALPQLNGAQRQRRAIAAGAPMEEVYATSVQETRQSYAQEVPTR